MKKRISSKSMLLALITCLSATLVSSSLLAFPETSENYTYVELALETRSNEALAFLQIDSLSLDVFHIETHLPKLKATCPKENRSPPKGTYWDDPKPLRICPALAAHSFGNYSSIGLYTHFYKVNVLVISGLINGEPFEITQRLENLLPREMSYILRPYTIEEGKKYYEFFGKPQLERNLVYRPTEPYQVSIGSNERSGTHLLVRTIEEITGEFIRSFPNTNATVFSQIQHVEAGELRGHQVYSYCAPAYVTHTLMGFHKKYKLSRQIVILRETLASADSFFHLKGTLDKHTCKFGGDYLNSEIYSKFMKSRAQYASNNIEERKNLIYSLKLPTVFQRYEDLVADPIGVMMSVMAFYAGVPAEVSFKEKIERVIMENGLSTFYRKEKHSTQLTKQEPKIAKLDKFPLHLVNYTLTRCSNIMEEFGYIEVYQERLNMTVTPSPRVNGLLKFQLQNQEIMEMMLKYRFDPNQIKHQLKRVKIEKRKKGFNEKEFFSSVSKFPIICPDNH